MQPLSPSIPLPPDQMLSTLHFGSASWYFDVSDTYTYIYTYTYTYTYTFVWWMKVSMWTQAAISATSDKGKMQGPQQVFFQTDMTYLTLPQTAWKKSLVTQ